MRYLAAALAGALAFLWLTPSRASEDIVSPTNSGFTVGTSNVVNTYLSVAVGRAEAVVAGAAEHAAWRGNHSGRAPYGGCKEAALYVGTPGWMWCARRGQVPGWQPMTPLFAHVLRQHYRQVNVHERWMRCVYRFKGGTTVVRCGERRYTS